MATVLTTPEAAGRRSCSRAPAPADPTRPRRGDRGRARSTGLRPAIRDLGPTAHDRRDRARPACAAAAAPASRPARSGGPRPRPRRRAATSSPTATAPTRRPAPTGPCSSATRTRSSRALAIAAFAIGANEAFIAVRAEDTEAIRRLEAAIGAADGRRASSARTPSGAGRDLTVAVRPVQGAYMLGEETVLLKALEGKRGQPEQRPPHPAERGLCGMPTVVHNVQTLAARRLDRPQRRRRRSPRSAPRRSPGTVLVQVADAGGRRHRRGPARDAAARDRRRSAAALPAGRSIKAVLVGGPSGGLLPPDALDTPVRLRRRCATAGAHIGSGSVVVADDRACIVDLARLLTRFCAGEACGKTIPCRIGTRRLVEIADRVVDGRPRPDRPRPAGRPLGRHRGLRAVRPRAPDDPPADERDAILPVRARRPHPPQHLPGRRLPPDRGGRRCGPHKATHGRPPHAPRQPPRPRPEPPSRSPSGCSRRSRRSGRSRRRASGSRSTAGSSRASRARRSSRSAATTASRSRPSATSRSCPGFGACRMCVVEVEGEEHPPISLLADVRAGDEGPDPDRGGPPAAPDEPRADLQRPQRLLPAALPEQVPEPHRHPGLPQGQRRGELARDRRGSSSARSRSPPSSAASARRRARSTAGATRSTRRSRSATATATPATRSSRRCSTRTSTRRVPFEHQAPTGRTRRGHRLRPGRHGRRVLPAARRPRRDGLRARPGAGRDAPLRHPAVPPAEGRGPRGRVRVGHPARRQDGLQRRPRPRLHPRRPDQPGLRRGRRRDRLLRHEQAGHPGRGRGRGPRRPRVPAHRDARPAVPGPRRQARRRHRRRLHLDGLLADVGPPGRRAR